MRVGWMTEAPLGSSRLTYEQRRLTIHLQSERHSAVTCYTMLWMAQARFRVSDPQPPPHLWSHVAKNDQGSNR